MKYRKISSPEEVARQLESRLIKHLNKGERVFWLIPGGSGMDLAVIIANLLKENPNLKNLTITLTDERYGQSGLPDSNWQQLTDKGFRLDGAMLIPVLDGSTLEINAQHYADMLNKELSAADYSIALAGMGADGHIFGIKPHSPAADSDKDVIGYVWDDYQRLTPTIKLLKKLNEVIIYAVGAEKRQQINDLGKPIPATEQPAQLLKQLNDVTIYNDYQEGEI